MVEIHAKSKRAYALLPPNHRDDSARYPDAHLLLRTSGDNFIRIHMSVAFFADKARERERERERKRQRVDYYSVAHTPAL
jgi:hypothetical protein